MNSKNTVLITDDEKFIQGMLTRFLKDDYEILNAFSGNECLSIANQKKPDIILLDVEMPEKNGYEVCHDLRNNVSTKDTPIIFLSSKSSVEERLLGYEAGGDDYLIKSSTAEELKAKIRRYTSISQQQKELIKDVDSAHMLNKMLEERVNRRTLKIEEQKNKLESAYQELKIAQKQLIQSEKMASIGQLAAGVAHEINNPVAFIKSNLCSLKNYVKSYQQLIEIQQKSLEQFYEIINSDDNKTLNNLKSFCDENDIDFINEDIHTLLNEAIVGTDRVQKITQGLKNYSRAADDGFQNIDLNICIEDTLKMLNNEIKYVCDVKTELTPIPIYKGNSSQLAQVFTNLIVNSVQAMDKNGCIFITSKLREEGSSKAIELTFSDTGIGIPEENLKKLFDPFFTTKPVGQGTGLGLSISYGIISDHGGKMEVNSEIGKGTIFTIILPLEKVPYH